jgi:hypothetical protein
VQGGTDGASTGAPGRRPGARACGQFPVDAGRGAADLTSPRRSWLTRRLGVATYRASAGNTFSSRNVRSAASNSPVFSVPSFVVGGVCVLNATT